MSILAREKQNTIRQRLEISAGIFVVLVDVSGRKDIPVGESNRNVYCVDEALNILWAIHAEDDEGDRRDSFVTLNYENGDLQARRFFGREYKVDLSGGDAKEIGWNK